MYNKIEVDMKKMRKLAALASAAILCISTVPYNVLAADSYADAEKSALDNALETFRAVYGKSLESSKKAYEGKKFCGSIGKI